MHVNEQTLTNTILPRGISGKLMPTFGEKHLILDEKRELDCIEGLIFVRNVINASRGF